MSTRYRRCTDVDWCGDVVQTDSVRELVKSWVRASWAAALFGASQIAGVFGRDDSEHMANAPEAVTRVVESQLSEGVRMLFQAGDEMQRDITNALFSPLSRGFEIPRLTAKMAIDLAQFTAGTAATVIPGRSQVAWLELQNKLETFNLFAHVDLTMDLPRTNTSLADLIERAMRLGPYRSVWATEGIGHFYAESSGTSAVNLRTAAPTLPRSSLIALHSGAGLSFAGRCLELIAARHTDAQVNAILDQFYVLCDGNSHESYAGATYEALGLATRNLYPQLLADIDRSLAETDEEMLAYFWHGVGRAIYFAPTNLVPDSNGSERLVKQAQEEPPHVLARLNALSGLVWALVLVNVRHPQVLEAFLRANVRKLNWEVVQSALCSAALIWRDSSPDDGALTVLCRHHPSDAETAALWSTHVSRPCTEVLRHYPALRNVGLGRLFRHRPMSELR